MTSDSTTSAAHHADSATRIVLARHGETAWSRTGQHTSVTDLPLTPVGENQARAIGRALDGHPFGLVLSSPRRRAVHTAELAGYGDALVIDDNLAEWDYGAYEGLTSQEIVARLGREWNLWDDGVPSGATLGETALDVQRRARAVIARCLPVLDSGADVLLVAHGHLLRGVAAAWLGLSASSGAVISLSTGTISELGFEHGRRVVLSWNCPPAAS